MTHLEARSIFPLGIRRPYFEARKEVEKRGKLPSQRDFHQENVLTETWKDKEKEYPLWGREIYVYPQVDRTFQKGQKIVDSESKLTVIDIEKALSPDEYINRIAVVLIITEIAEINEYNGSITIIPKVIVPLSNVLRSTNIELPGLLDKDNLLPYPPKRAPQSSLRKMGSFWTSEHMGVRPAVRQVDSINSRYAIYANVRHTVPVGVAMVDEIQETGVPNHISTEGDLIRELEIKWGIKN